MKQDITIPLPSNAFIHLRPKDAADATTTVIYRNIPFNVVTTDKGYKNQAPAFFEVKQPLERIFFLGLATDKPEGSEWWGLNERFYNQHQRLFIGDWLGRIHIEYADQTIEIIPLIFGVNIWCYELCTPFKPGEEKYLNKYMGPFCEPFASDSKAQALLDASLHLMVNDTIKGGRFIFGVTPQPKPITAINLLPQDYRAAGFQVTAVTGLRPGVLQNITKDWKCYDERYFAQKRYYPAMDRLARRLYQFRDELPSSIMLEPPKDYQGPMVQFSGNGMADIFTNVYLQNSWDMARDKVDAEGGMHTSSKHAPNFGLYVGIGTYRNDAGLFYSHIWARDVGRSLSEVVEWGESERTKKAGEKLLEKYLYSRSTRFHQPHWQRIANAADLNNESQLESVSGKENDGHGSLMLFIYRLLVLT